VGAYQHYARLTEDFRATALLTLRERRSQLAPPFALHQIRTMASLLIGLDRMGLTKVPYLHALAAYGKRLAREVRRARADIVEVTMPWLVPIRRHLPPSVKVVLLMQNVESLYYEEAIGRSLCPTFMRAWMRYIERRAVGLADHVITLVEEDRRFICENYGKSLGQVTAIPPGFDPDKETVQRPTVPNASSRVQAVFVGSRFSGNPSGLRGLVREVASACLEFADFWIVGTVCEVLRDQQVPPNVKLLGFVDDLRGVLRRCDVFINPVSMTTSLNSKILDALACGLRVLSTPDGARGFEPLIGTVIQVASLRDFAACLRNSRGLSPVGYENVQAYAWPSIVRRRLAIYESLLDSGGHPEVGHRCA
jgi:glycosyltransferase involved in cell wall biosynthesis